MVVLWLGALKEPKAATCCTRTQSHVKCFELNQLHRSHAELGGERLDFQHEEENDCTVLSGIQLVHGALQAKRAYALI